VGWRNFIKLMCTHTRNVANRWPARSNGLMLKHRDAH